MTTYTKMQGEGTTVPLFCISMTKTHAMTCYDGGERKSQYIGILKHICQEPFGSKTTLFQLLTKEN